MKTPEEKRWERMQQLLLAESNGEAPVRISSQRTLFGIRSHVEEVVEAVAAEDRAKCEEAAKSKSGAFESCSAVEALTPSCAKRSRSGDAD